MQTYKNKLQSFCAQCRLAGFEVSTYEKCQRGAREELP